MGRAKSAVISVVNTLIPLIFAFAIGAVFLLIVGYNPLETYAMIFSKALGSVTGIMQTLGFATPIIMTGIATAFCYRAGIFNLGIEGQLYMGAIAATVVGAGYLGLDNLPVYIHLPLAILAGVLFGMLYAVIPALLKAYLKINEVVTTIMLNYVAIYFTSYVVKGWLQGELTYDSSNRILDTAIIPKFSSRYRVTFAVIISVAIVLIIWFILAKTKFGFEMNSIGRQLEFSEAAGMRVKRKIVVIFLISGAIAGIAGATEILGVNLSFTPEFSTNPGLGWQGYFVAVLARSNPIAVLLIAILFGAFRYGGIAAQSATGIPLDLLNIIQSALILFYAVQYIGSSSRLFGFLDKLRLPKRQEAEK